MKVFRSARAWVIAILLAAYLALLGIAALSIGTHESQGGEGVSGNDADAP